MDIRQVGDAPSAVPRRGARGTGRRYEIGAIVASAMAQTSTAPRDRRRPARCCCPGLRSKEVARRGKIVEMSPPSAVSARRGMSVRRATAQITAPAAAAVAARRVASCESSGPRSKKPFGEMRRALRDRPRSRRRGPRVQRPEAAFGQPEQWTAPEPAEGDDGRGGAKPAKADERGQIFPRDGADPGGGNQWRGPEQSMLGTKSSGVQANTSFGRLISASRLPASDKRERRLVLTHHPQRRHGEDG